MNAAQLRTLFLILLIAAPVFILAGAVMKIQHWPIGNVVLGGGLLLELFCAAGLAVLSWRSRKSR